MKKILLLAVMIFTTTIVQAHYLHHGGFYYNILYRDNMSTAYVEVTFEGSTPFEYSQEYSGNIIIPNTFYYYSDSNHQIKNTFYVVAIGEAAFANCDRLISVKIPESVTTIGTVAFEYCRLLESVTIPESVTSIGRDAFHDCTGLNSVTIPESVTSIGEGAFRGSNIDYITMPESITTIENKMFEDCLWLSSVTLGSYVTTIGEYAFNGCSRLEEVTCKAVVPPTISNNTFSNYDANLYVPAESVEAYKVAEYWKNFNNIFATSSTELIGDDSGAPSIEVINGEIVVNNGADAQISVYTISGTMIYQGANRSVAVEKGVYVVLVDGKATKVMI